MRYVDTSTLPFIRPSAALPPGFVYPSAFLEFVLAHDGFPAELAPWVPEPNWPEVEKRVSGHTGYSVVMFGYAQLEDAAACFAADQAHAGRVVVVNPFLHREVDGAWHQDKCVTYADLESFEAWLDWTKTNEWVYLDQRPRDA